LQTAQTTNLANSSGYKFSTIIFVAFTSTFVEQKYFYSLDPFDKFVH